MNKIALSGKTENEKFALVDDEDFKRFGKFKWYLNISGYAARPKYLGKINGKYKSVTVFLHREILNCPKGMEVDHINGNRLDNRRENLRICTHAKNMVNRGVYKNNTSKFKGVSKHKGENKWRAIVAGKQIGQFDTDIEAARAYNAKMIELHGEFAKLNPV